MADSGSKIQGGTNKNDKNKPRGNESEQSGGNNKRRGSRGVQESSNQKAQLELEYFGNYKGSTMTVVFHAILSPNFKFEPSYGDKIFMRFGGLAFGDFNEDVVKVQPER